MPRALRFTLIGCGGLLGLFVLFAACTAIISGNQDTSTEKAEKEAGSEEAEKKEQPKKKDKGQAKDEQQTVSIGETVEVGDVAWTVTNARRANELNSQFLEPRQGNYVIVDFNFLNGGSEPVTLSQNSLSLLDSQDRTSQPDTDTFGYIDPNKNILLEQVNPGVTEQGEVIFSVAPDASGFRLEVGDTGLFSNESAYIDLGF